MVEEFVAEVDALLFESLASDRREKDNRFSFFLIRHTDDGDFAFGFGVEPEDFVDRGFQSFVRNHFACDF